MNLKLKKVYTVSKKGKPEKPRLFLQHIVCEAAGLQPQDELYIKVNEEKEEILMQNFPFEDEEGIHTVHVASRKNKISGKERPLVDTAGQRYSFLDINQKIEVNVYKEGRQKSLSGRSNINYLITVRLKLLKTKEFGFYQFVRGLV
jgi:DNA (cytosine-5)-methyltransferase 1